MTSKIIQSTCILLYQKLSGSNTDQNIQIDCYRALYSSYINELLQTLNRKYLNWAPSSLKAASLHVDIVQLDLYLSHFKFW